MSVFDDVSVINGNYRAADAQAFSMVRCPRCSASQAGVVAFTREGPFIQWLRCTNCMTGLVSVDGVVSPPTLPLSVPHGLPSDVAAAWEEVRRCLGVRADTAAVMLCRKLLFHIAVDHGIKPKDAKGWAPTFAAAATHLENEGVFTKRMRPWVERIKDVGNEANHEIETVNLEAAMDVARFTEQLLRLAYEMDALVAGRSDA